ACLPGAKAGAGVKQATLTARSLVDACIADGFDYTGWGGGPPPGCAASHYLVAVFMDARHSFHFARQDEIAKVRQWVHKPSAAQGAHNLQNNYLLGTDLS